MKDSNYKMNGIFKYSIFLLLILYNLNASAGNKQNENFPLSYDDRLEFKLINNCEEISSNEELLNDLKNVEKYQSPTQVMEEIDRRVTKAVNCYERENSILPIMREIKRPLNNDPYTFSCYGYNLKLPWKGKVEITKTKFCTILVSFKNWIVIIDDPNNPSNAIGSMMYESWISDYMDQLFNMPVVRNAYEFDKRVLYASNNKFNKAEYLWDDIKRKAYLLILLKYKNMYVGTKKKEHLIDTIYEFNESNIKGFQIGRPGKSKFIQLLLYPENDVGAYLLIGSGKNRKVSQDEIDFIIGHFEKEEQY